MSFITVLGGKSSKKRSENDKRRKSGKPRFDVERIVKATMVVMMLNFQIALECAYLGLVVTFVVRQLSWTKTMSMFIVSVLAVAVLVAMGCAAVLSKWLPSKVIVITDIIVTFVASVVLSIFVMYHEAVIWVCSIVITMACATSSPAILAWAAQEIPPSTKVSAAYISSFATNLFLGATVFAFFFHKYGPMWFCYLTVIYSFILILLFTSSICIFQYLNNRRSNNQPPGESEAVDLKATEEL